jgi:hypothetical protein
MNKRQIIEKNFLSLEGSSKPIHTSKLSNYELELEQFTYPAEDITGLRRWNSMVLVKV